MERGAVKKALRDAGYEVSDKTLQRMSSKLGIRRVRTGFGGPMKLVLGPYGDSQSGRAGESDEGNVQSVQNVQIGLPPVSRTRGYAA